MCIMVRRQVQKKRAEKFPRIEQYKSIIEEWKYNDTKKEVSLQSLGSPVIQLVCDQEQKRIRILTGLKCLFLEFSKIPQRNSKVKLARDRTQLITDTRLTLIDSHVNPCMDRKVLISISYNVFVYMQLITERKILHWLDDVDIQMR